MGCDPSTGKLLLCWGPYSRRYKNGNNMADTQRRRKAYGYENKTRKGTQKCKKYYMLKMI